MQKHLKWYQFTLVQWFVLTFAIGFMIAYVPAFWEHFGPKIAYSIQLIDVAIRTGDITLMFKDMSKPL